MLASIKGPSSLKLLILICGMVWSPTVKEKHRFKVYGIGVHITDMRIRKKEEHPSYTPPDVIKTVE
jgi:hypothetical protein